MYRRILVICILVCGLAMALTWAAAAKVQPGEPEGELLAPQTDGDPVTLRLNLGVDDPILDPALVNTLPSMFMVNQLFLGLTRVDDESGAILPELASSWEMSADAQVFTFTLRGDATWTDGNPVTAEDVRYGILRSLHPDTEAPLEYPMFLIENAEDYNEGIITNPDLVGVTVLDSTHLRFELNRPGADLPSILALPAAKTMPEGTISTHPDDWTEPDNIVTNGAYELAAWAHDDALFLAKNPDYFDAGSVQIEQVSLLVLDDISAWNLYLNQTGQLDSVLVPGDQWSAAQSDPLLAQELHAAPRNCIYYYGFNTNKEPFDDPLVRQAFIAAVVRQGVIDEALGGPQQPALTFTPPGVFGHVDGLAEGVGIPYNPTQAQAWLAAAGYPGGAGLPPITLMYNTLPGHQAVAEAVQQGWYDDLGATVELSHTVWSEYQELLHTDPPQIWRMGWCGDYDDARNFLNDAVFSNLYFGSWDTTAYENLLELAAGTANATTRWDLYKQAEEILVESDAVALPIYYYADGVATKPYLQRAHSRGGYGGRIADWTTTSIAPPPMEVGAPVTLRLNLGTNDPVLDPSFPVWSDLPYRFVVDQLFLGLTGVDDESGTVLPELASSWEMSADAMVFTFTLRADAIWTDGSPVTAQDARYGILRSLHPDTNATWEYPLFLIENAEDYNEGFITNPDLVGVTVLDSTHLRFDLNRPGADLPSILTLPAAKAMPEWVISAHPDDWTEPENIVTNGAYELAAWAHDEALFLQKNLDYFDSWNVQIEQVSFLMLEDAIAWELYLNQTGQLDSVLVPEQWGAAQGDPLLAQELHAAPRNCIYYYGFNTDKEPFDDPLVRKAFIAAVDRQGVIDEALEGTQQPALTFTPPGVFGHVDGVSEGVGIPYNPGQAQNWLTAAGYPGGAGLPPITLMYNTLPGHQAVAEAMQQGWFDDLGVTVSLADLPWNEYLELLRTDSPQIWRMGWCGDYDDARNFLNDAVLSNLYFGSWDTTAYEALLDLAVSTASATTRQDLYKQAEEILVESDAVALPIYYLSNGVATKPYLERTHGHGGYGGRIADWRIHFVNTLVGVGGGSLTSYDGDTMFEFPPGAFSSPVIIAYQPAAGMFPGMNINVIGDMFELTAVYSGTYLPAQIEPGFSYSVTLQYSQADIGPTNEGSLKLYWWDDGLGLWSQEGISSSVDEGANQVTASVNHFSIFAVLGETYRTYLPLAVKGY